MLIYAIYASFGLLSLSMLLALLRLVRGPGVPDRALAIDTAYVVGMCLLILKGIFDGGKFYFEAALVIAVISYISTVAVAKFMLRGDIIEK